LTTIIALVVIWWFQQTSTETSTSNVINYPETVAKNGISQEALPIEETVNSDTATLIPSQIIENTSLDDPAGSEQLITGNQSISSEVESDSSTLALLTDATETTVIETAAPVKLIFEFSGDCWMNLTDATGENIAYGVKVKGRVMPVTGIPPFEVTLGAPEVVKIRYAGESLDMSFLPFGRIAKFDLPLSE
jgi:cytoskeleton protein RodZ